VQKPRGRHLRGAGAVASRGALRAALALAMLVGMWVRPARADLTKVLNAVADTSISEGVQVNSNGQGTMMMAGLTNSLNEGLRRRALFKFDLSSVPANSVATSVTIKLVMLKNGTGYATNFYLAPVLQSWGEAGSVAPQGSGGGKLVQALAGDATWMARKYLSNAWTTAGGTIGSISATQKFPALDGTSPDRTFQSTTSLETDVTNWLNGSVANNGWMLMGEEDWSKLADLGGPGVNAPASIAWFGTVDANNGTAAQLTLKYKLPPGAACNATNDCTTNHFCIDKVCCNTNGCNGPTDCSPKQTCQPNTGNCSTTVFPANTPCTDDGLECTTDVCNNAGQCKHNADRGGSNCGSAPSGACDAQDTCVNGNNQCVDNKKANGAACGTSDNNPCTVDQCDGNSKSCPYKPGNKGASCGNPATLPCDLPETCDGTNAACPSDAFVAAGTPCGAPKCVNSTTALLPTSCTGSTPACPAQQTLDCTPKTCSGVACENSCVQDSQCASGFYCNPPDCLATKTNGKTCSLGHECQSGNCVDGVCCNTPCGGGDPTDCQSCTTGTCSLLTSTCRAANASDKCDKPEVCSGSATSCPADAVEPATTQCTPASCSNGVETAQAFCPGNGGKQCPPLVQRNCAPYVCGATACKTSCANSSDCNAANYCAGGSCVPRVPRGGSCTATGQCESGLSCADGFCCNSACAGQCQACDITPGTCTTVPSGPPHGSRPACGSDGSVCSGSCNGTVTTSCAYAGASTECIAASCTAGVETLRSVCNGAGSCNPETKADCSPFSCGPTACFGNCSSDVQCESGRYCLAGNCVPKLDNGKACSSGSQCLSRLCVDGFCCNGGCDGQCEACNVAGSEGTCSPVSGNPVGGRPQCVTDGTVCGGVCDGKLRTSCTYLGAGTSCRADKCESSLATLGAFCNGAGTCPPEVTQDCGAVGCDAKHTRCAGDCTVDTDCSFSEVCSAGICRNKGGNGTMCARDDECVGGICTDGFCCNAACQGQCEACDVAGREGTCTAVSGPPHGTRVPCATDGSACAGVCDGKLNKQCAYPDAETQCGAAASCAGGIARLPSFCVGSGACPDNLSQICPGACSGARCAGGCANDAACGAGQFCSAGVCVTKLTNGSICALDSQCGSGFCVEGACCEALCDQQCFSCAIPGRVGQCAPVTGAARGGRTPCEGEGPCAAQCKGDLEGTCGFPKSDVFCGVGSCANGVASGLAVCSGAGTCLPPAQLGCAPYVCDGAACFTECTSDDQCQNGFNCALGACVPDASPGEGGAPGSAGAPSGGDGSEPSSQGGDPGANAMGGAPTTMMPSNTAGEPSEQPGAAGTPDGSGTGGGTGAGQSKDDGGCGCRVPRGPSGAGWPVLAGLGLSLVLARRRRKERARNGARFAA
jgi:MYXO-CTERM domain-containing protein